MPVVGHCMIPSHHALAVYQTSSSSAHDSTISSHGNLFAATICDPLTSSVFSFSSIDGLCQAVEDGEGSSSSDIRCVMLFDNEEVSDLPRLIEASLPISGVAC